MSDKLPKIYLARHGETEWSLSGQHTGLTDIPLTPAASATPAAWANGSRVCTSPRCSPVPCSAPGERVSWPASVPAPRSIADLVEWNYGDYEGKRTADIRKERPDWYLFRDGCPGGETVAAIGAGRSRHRAVASRRRRCAAVLARSFPPRPRRTLARLCPYREAGISC